MAIHHRVQREQSSSGILERYSSVAAMYGWWTYLFLAAFVLAATSGVFFFIMILRRRIRVLGNRDIAARMNLDDIRVTRDRAFVLHGALIELLAEHQSIPPTHPDFNEPLDGMNDKQNWDRNTQKWQRRNFEIRDALARKYMLKYKRLCEAVASLAAPYSNSAAHKIERLRWSSSAHEHDIQQMSHLMLDVAIELTRLLRAQDEYEPTEQLLAISD